MEDAGQKLKRARERLNLRYRDVEEASNRIAELRQNKEFSIALSRLSDIENKGTVPTIYRLYSLCAVYRLDLTQVLEWYGVDLAVLPADAAALPLENTHLLGFGPAIHGEVQVPLVVDPAVDLSQTTYLSRAIRRWGKLPLSLLNAVDLVHHRYAFVGSQDWFMYPLLQPGALVMIDETPAQDRQLRLEQRIRAPYLFSGASRRLRGGLVHAERRPVDPAAAPGLGVFARGLCASVRHRRDWSGIRRGYDPGSGEAAPNSRLSRASRVSRSPAKSRRSKSCAVGGIQPWYGAEAVQRANKSAGCGVSARYSRRSACCCSRFKHSQSWNTRAWLRRRVSPASSSPTICARPGCSYVPFVASRSEER